MAEARTVAFELERFEWARDDLLEVVGRWQGVSGRRLARPVLHVDANGRRHRLTAVPGGQLGAGAERWRAAFSWPHGPADVEAAELEIGRSLLVELPAPRRRSRRARGPREDERLREELAELRAAIAELRSSRPDSEAQVIAAEPMPAEAAEAALEPEPRELAALRGERETLQAELAGVRHELDTLADRYAALIARSGDLRGDLADAHALEQRLTAQLREAEAERDRLAVELAAQQESAEERLNAERTETQGVHEKLASAREEAHKAMAAEAEETERLRTELAQSREEAERALAAERAETARMREELAARPQSTGDEADDAESDASGRRMYERVSRELERERATIRTLRRELDDARSQGAQQRREDATAATNGTVTTTEEAPAPATAGARARGRRAAAAIAARSDAEQRLPYRRVEAARAAAAQRVPEHEQSTANVWVVRAAAIAVVAVLLIALLIIVSSLA